MAYYAGYAASISKESPFRLYSQKSFSCDLSCDLRIPDQSAPVQPKVVLQQHQQQQHQKHHLQQQLQQRVLQHTQSQQQRFNVTWSLVWCALLVTAIAGAMFAFAPLSYPSQSLTNTNLVERQSVMVSLRLQLCFEHAFGLQRIAGQQSAYESAAATAAHPAVSTTSILLLLYPMLLTYAPLYVCCATGSDSRHHQVPSEPRQQLSQQPL